MDWNIRKGGEACTRCGAALENGAFYYSTLISLEEQLSRFDYCHACFGALPREESAVFWKARRAESGPAKKAVNFESLRELFVRMVASEERQFREMAYLLGLVLVRKRLLKLKDFVSREGRDYREVQQKADAPRLLVEVPLLDDAAIAVLRDRLSQLLDADLDNSIDIHDSKQVTTDPQAEATAADATSDFTPS